MPYTQEQIEHVSRYVRRYADRGFDSWVVNQALFTLRRYEVESRWKTELALEAVETIECRGCGEVAGYIDAEGETHYRDPDEVVTIDDLVFCTSECAYESGWDYCQRCGEWGWAEDMVYIEDAGLYCSEHCATRSGYTRCECCGEWTSDHEVHEVETSGGSELWCEGCCEYTSLCEGCGDRFPDDDLHECDGDYYCESCYGDAEIFPYDYDPAVRFFGGRGSGKNADLMMGVELETDGGYERRRYAAELNALPKFHEHFWMTDDGSLDNGVEITSHPMTLAYHLSLMDTYVGIKETANRFDYTSHDNGRCGLHVSVNRDFFGSSTVVQDAGVYKMMRLYQRFEQQLYIFSRRDRYELDRWATFKTSLDYSPKEPTVDVKGGRSEGLFEKARRFKENDRSKYRAVNICHPNHVEIRIFRGTLKWSTYFASLALVEGLARVAKAKSSFWVESVTWYDLVPEVLAAVSVPECAEYLRGYLTERGLL